MKKVFYLSGDRVFEATLARETNQFYIFRKSDGREDKEMKRSNGAATWKGLLYDSRSDAMAALVAMKERQLEGLLDEIPVLRATIKKLHEELLAVCQSEEA